MAMLCDILTYFWPNTQYTVGEDDYSTLNWYPENTLPKPTEEEIRAHSAETDALLADMQQRVRQQNAMESEFPDYLLKIVETLIDGLAEIRRVVNDIRNTATPASHVGDYTAWDAEVVSRITALYQRVRQLRQIP